MELNRKLPSWCPGFLINSVSHNKKAMRGKIAWLKLPVGNRTLAPFDGITRIRFKGSSNWTSQPLRLPRLVEMRLRPDPGKSTRRQIANHCMLDGLQR